MFKHRTALPHFAQGYFRTLVHAQPKVCLYFIAILELQLATAESRCQGKRDRKTERTEQGINTELGEHTGKFESQSNPMVKDFLK